MALVMSGLYVSSKIIGDMLEKDIIVKTISSTNSKIFGIIADYLYGEVLVKSTIEKLDIVHKLEVIESYIDNLPHDVEENKTLMMSLNGIHRICDKIHEELDGMKKKIVEHKEKYFYYVRSLDISEDLVQLEMHVKNLDNRFSLFLNIRN